VSLLCCVCQPFKKTKKNRPDSLLLCPLVSGGPGKGGGEDPAKSSEQEDRTRPQILSGSGFCKWFNVRMGFGFISMTNSEGSPVDPPLDVFVHQVSCQKQKHKTPRAINICSAMVALIQIRLFFFLKRGEATSDQFVSFPLPKTSKH